MKIESSLIDVNLYKDISPPILIAQTTIDKAKELTNDSQKALIYDDKIIALSLENIEELHNFFAGDIKIYEDVFIATNKAKSYLYKIVNFVMDDLNIKNADKNSDGILTVSESLDSKSMLHDGEIKKPKDLLSPEEINIFQQNHSIFSSINEIINENIKMDTDKDGEVTVKEVEKGLKTSSSKPTSTLSVLYKKLASIEEQINKSQSNNSAETNAMLSSLNGEKGVILGQIKKLLELGMHK